MNKCYVYVLEDEHNRLKIGYTTLEVEERKRQLQTGNSEILKILYYRKFEQCARAENAIHAIFAAKRTSRKRKHGGWEWFTLDDNERKLLEKIFTLENISEAEKASLKRLGLL